MNNRLVELLHASWLLQTMVAFTMVFAVKWPVLHTPPVWDAAMGVFPAAITLKNNGFNLLELLAQPGYLAGGPNSHADSLMTLLTAVFLKLTEGSGLGIPTVHLLHFLIAALTLVAMYRYARPLLGAILSLLGCVAVLAFPLFFVQAGYMYLEMPLTFCAVMALLEWRQNKLYRVAFWVLIACWVKQTGIIVVGALVLAALLERRPLRQKISRILGVSILPLILISSWLAILGPAERSSVPPPLLTYMQMIWFNAQQYLLAVPDLALFLVLFLLTSALNYEKVIAGLRYAAPTQATASSDLLPANILGLNALMVVSFYAVFYVISLPVRGFPHVLPRYYMMLLPFVFTTLIYGLQQCLSRKNTVLALLVVTAFFVVNRNGTFYPPDVDTDRRGIGNNFALTERSAAYRDLLSVQTQAMRYLGTIPPAYPIYVGLHEHYLNQYPEMGYVEATMKNTRLITAVKLNFECAYFLYNYPWLGGRVIATILKIARADPSKDTEIVKLFQQGPYKIRLIRIKRKGSTCPL